MFVKYTYTKCARVHHEKETLECSQQLLTKRTRAIEPHQCTLSLLLSESEQIQGHLQHDKNIYK